MGTATGGGEGTTRDVHGVLHVKGSAVSRTVKDRGRDRAFADRLGMPWPAVGFEPQVWDWKGEPPARADRLFRDYTSSDPPAIGAATVQLDGVTAAALESATIAVAALDNDTNSHLASVAGALLRSEPVGSSKIEHLDTDAQTLALAAIGETKRWSVAAQVWSNVEAMETALRLGGDGVFDTGTVLAIHKTLMRDDPNEAAWAGRVRDMQNWIGGSDDCPRDAMFVPPDPRHVGPLLDDLAVFCGRTNLPGLAQAAIAHAQFETIHPFTDGNGRTGCALIHTVLRRRKVTNRVVVPTSAALLTDIDGYFGALGDYRGGDVNRYLVHVAAATERAAVEARLLGSELREIAVERAEVCARAQGRR